jgi:hypothetical protein
MVTWIQLKMRVQLDKEIFRKTSIIVANLALCSLILIGIMPSMTLARVGDGIIEEGEEATAELARAAQNPIASMISLPFQNNTNFGFGPQEKTQNILNIQPVWPFEMTENWNLIYKPHFSTEKPSFLLLGN